MSKNLRPALVLTAVAAGLALLIVTLRRPASELEPYQLAPRSGFSSTAPRPDWAELERYQRTISRAAFLDQLRRVYSQGEAWRSAVEIHDDYAELHAGGDTRWRLDFAKDTPTEKPPRYWRAAADLSPSSNLSNKPLESIRIAIDPGHIGGEWAKMEERWFQIGGAGVEVKEGDMTLRTAQVLKAKLETLGADVWLLRDRNEPVTALRPGDFVALAETVLGQAGSETSAGAVEKMSEQLFYRAHEIRRRAQVVNDDIRPDLVLCLHYNAEAWGDPNAPRLVDRNHFHLLINGTYSAAEFRLEDNRFHLFKRLLQRTHDEELSLGEAVAASMLEATGLPPYVYFTRNAKSIGDSGAVYARNLLANRIYHCPVVFLEPYVMNSREVYQRVAAGDYEGERVVANAMRKSLVREYADGVAEGLRRYYALARKP